MNKFENFGLGRFIAFTVLLSFGLAVPLGLAHDASPHAPPYSNRDKVYLNEIYPILTDLSEVGTAVSDTALGLQSAPTEECKNENNFYQGIVSDLRGRLSAITPPTRMKPVHVKALDGFSDYITGLNLYVSACVDKDTQMRSKLFYQGTQYIKNAERTMQSVNDFIANPKHIPARPAATDQIKEWCASRWAGDSQQQGYCIKTQTESRTKLGELLQRYPRGTQQNNIILDCTAGWTDHTGAYNYRMIYFCAMDKIN